ncbi:MAG: Fic family protein [Candidatus Saganbacteria bacterium]|nr:Fic family protein [Candidatus Saganbacteria bacterium]
MFKPRYSITNKLLENIKRITELVTQLNSKRFPRVVLMAMEKEARELSSHTSTSIEGNPLPLTEVKRILKTRPGNLRDTEREVINYNRALEDLNKLLRKGPPLLSSKLVLDIQRSITKGLIEKHRCGRLRDEPVFVNDPRTGKTIYWPPDQKDVKKLLDELLEYTGKNKVRTDPLILAGIFHKQFVIIHPFMDGNGRTSRLATKVLLASMGLDTFNLFSFENYYNKNVGKYFEKVGVRNNYYNIKESVDFTGWLEYFTDGIIDELLRVSKELEASALSPKTALRTCDKQVIDHIKKHGYITDKEYSGLTKRAKATRNKDFNRLIDMGLIKKLGKGKATYYKLR